MYFQYDFGHITSQNLEMKIEKISGKKFNFSRKFCPSVDFDPEFFYEFQSIMSSRTEK